MTQVQVIAGLDERLVMNRPVVQDMFDQFHTCPLLGLEHIVEVLQGASDPLYHCALCNIDTTAPDLVKHLTSLNHLLTFVKEFFPVAWMRFSPLTDFSTWLKSDFECLDLVVNKIDQVHGRKKPVIIENKSKLEEAVNKISQTSYNARKTELDTFFKKSLTPVEPRKISPKEAKNPKKIVKKSVLFCPAFSIEKLEFQPKQNQSIDIKVQNLGQSMEGAKFVKVSQALTYRGQLRVKPSFSRLWQDGADVFVKAYVINPWHYKVTLARRKEICQITWSQ